MTETEKLLLTLAVTVLGSGVGTTIVGIWFKKRVDTQLEVHRALLGRGSRVHDRQIDALLLVYSKLERASFLLQRAASSLVLAGEIKEQLVKQMVEELSEASQAYSERKLLIPPSLALTLDQFFGRFLAARVDLSYALWDVVPPGEQKAALWDSAQTIAYKELPPMLEAIEKEARAIVHSETKALIRSA